MRGPVLLLGLLTQQPQQRKKAREASVHAAQVAATLGGSVVHRLAAGTLSVHGGLDAGGAFGWAAGTSGEWYHSAGAAKPYRV